MDEPDRPVNVTKKDDLLTWAERVFADAGLSPTQHQVTEIAGTIAHLIMSERLVPYAKAHGVAELFGAWLAQMGVRRENVLENIDGAHSILIVMLAEELEVHDDDPQRASVETRISREINELFSQEMSKSHDEFVEGVREEFGPTTPDETDSPGVATSSAAAGGGCLLTVIGIAVTLALSIVVAITHG
jgi:hypothetical protein